MGQPELLKRKRMLAGLRSWNRAHENTGCHTQCKHILGIAKIRIAPICQGV